MSEGIVAVADAYDYGMRHPLLREYYGDSDFFNYGYWREDTHDQQAACENLMDQLLEFIPDKRGTLLDVACGMGATTRSLLKYYNRSSLIGINISQAQLARSKLNAPGCTFHLMDATHLGFGANAFDNLICVESAFHFNTREDFLREARRVLKPGGSLVLSDILFLVVPGRRNRRLPAANLVGDVEQYRAGYRRAGFQEVEIVDATRECWGGFRQHLMQWGWQKLLSREVDLPTWCRQMIKLLAGNIVIRHYLLISARK